MGDLRQVLVLLTNVVLLAKVDQVDDGLRRKEEERVDNFDLEWKVSVMRHWYQKCEVSFETGRSELDFFSSILCVNEAVSKSWDYRAIALCHLVKGRYERSYAITTYLLW